MNQIRLSLIILIGAIMLSFDCALAQTTLILQPDSTTGKDAFVNSNFPMSNYGSSRGFHSAVWTWSGVYGIVRSFIQFDLSSIPPNANILSANLSLFNDPGNNFILTNGEHSNLSASNRSFISRVTDPWSENSINWNNQPNSDTLNQVSLSESTSPNQDYLNIDVGNMIQYMTNNPTQNHGFILRLQNEIDYAALIFASSDHSNSLLHPKLEITYSVPTSLDETWIEGNSFVKVFPNPTDGELDIDFDEMLPNTQLMVLNNMGQLLFSRHYEYTDHIKVNFDLPQGVYFLRILSHEDKVKTVKVLIE